jgi:hypothetical protein
MKTKRNLNLMTFTIFLGLFMYFNSHAQDIDWRNVKHGSLIYTYGYCDQPYVVVLEDGTWLCVFTTNAGHEGTGGQHIVATTSMDKGKTWSKPVRIEEPTDESASWAMPYLTEYGRVYVFYMYNGDKIHELRGNKIREDMLGWYCFKYTDDGGNTWSERYRLDVPITDVDLRNDWSGEVQIMWGIGKPIDVGKGMMFAFSKIGKFLVDDDEGWFFRCDNINKERNPDKLRWRILPANTQIGMRNLELGPVNEEQNIVQMSNGTIYCMYRTIAGYPAESYSYNRGKSWTTPRVPEYTDGIKLKNPRACPRIWKTSDGKYLFWYHNHGGWGFPERNPAWISGGIEKDGKIIWSQPEILLYEDDVDKRMSYPDMIEQDGKYWITETNKVDARVHPIPAEFFNTIWSQFDRESVTMEGLTAEWNENQLEHNQVLRVPSKAGVDYRKGVTLDLRLELGDLAPGQLILKATSKNGKSIELKTAEYGSVEIILNDGNRTDRWNSDPGLLTPFWERCMSVTVDNGPRIIQFVVDGTVCNGRDIRQYGWGRFTTDMKDFTFDTLETGRLIVRTERGQLKNLRIYNRPLMNTEIIGNHNHFKL